MAITGQGIRFFPIFWCFHDNWQFYIPPSFPGGSPVIFDHFGHVHFSMLGYDVERDGGDAFSGQQQYRFDIKDVWGPRSSDPNQNNLYRVIGTPKWYYQVTELWRRVFVQPWAVAGSQGVQFDASDKFMGPFREGLANHGMTSYSPYFLAGARSLPIEYFKDGTMSQASRDNYVGDRAKALLGADFDAEKYRTDHGNYLMAHYGFGGDEGGDHAGVDPFPDELYIYPIIEYQKVVHLDWEIMPGSTPDVDNPEDATDDYGDGWGTQVTSPFIDPTTQKYRSPFANEPGQVLPFGSYNEWSAISGRKLVPLASRLKFNAAPAYPDPRPYDHRIDLGPH